MDGGGGDGIGQCAAILPLDTIPRLTRGCAPRVADRPDRVIVVDVGEGRRGYGVGGIPPRQRRRRGHRPRLLPTPTRRRRLRFLLLYGRASLDLDVLLAIRPPREVVVVVVDIDLRYSHASLTWSLPRSDSAASRFVRNSGFVDQMSSTSRRLHPDLRI